ncbi:MAG TPA: hypothetical protein VEK82_06610 [Stellaceae bacterium]|nr:hypothetical protein [Stellaceae bacterium]
MAKLKRRAGKSEKAELRKTLRRALGGADDVDFENVAAKLRALTSGRKHTSAEILQREGRDDCRSQQDR